MDKFLIVGPDYYNNLESRFIHAYNFGVTKVYLREFYIDRFYFFRSLCSKYNFSLFVYFKFVVDYHIIDSVDGIHLKSGDLSVINDLPKGVLFSYSAHSIHDVILAYNAGVDYIFLGPIFTVEGKMSPLGLEYINNIPYKYKSKIYALGGINLLNINSFVNTGIKGIAGIRLFL